MKRTLFAAALAAASLAVFAQPYGPGYGPGPGHGPPAGSAGCCGANVTPGWAMMTEEERAKHQERMRGMKDYTECQAYLGEHQKLMQERGKQRGQQPPQGPGPGCQWLKKPA